MTLFSKQVRQTVIRLLSIGAGLHKGLSFASLSISPPLSLLLPYFFEGIIGFEPI